MSKDILGAKIRDLQTATYISDETGSRSTAIAKLESLEKTSLPNAVKIARTSERNSATTALAAAAKSWEERSGVAALAAAAKSWDERSGMKALAAAAKSWENNQSFKAALAATRSLGANASLKKLAESALSLNRWGITESLTVEAVLDELATRATISFEQEEQEPSQLLLEDDKQTSRQSDKNSAAVSASRKALRGMPTWALWFWLYFVAPIVFVTVHWESARQGLVDINARLPQTESISEIRNFIRTELSGKPGDIRLIKGNQVRLREGPGMKYEVLLTLPRDTIVTVLDKENRTWLYVSYEHHGYLVDGYVSNKFLKKIRK
ncbi:SH3 domain-containing protein [Bordetella bronchiseptica]|uniref:SH3 domain-containing protein n=1 Tax=Bordetella bronchiseptica TaxID=518 RepID=UPI0012693D1D|nr:SH3 domain-containing protein [Bordetella bronchiseptica]